MGTDIFPTKDGIGRPTRGSEAATMEDGPRCTSPIIKTSVNEFRHYGRRLASRFCPAARPRIQGFSILLFTNGGDQAVYNSVTVSLVSTGRRRPFSSGSQAT